MSFTFCLDIGCGFHHGDRKKGDAERYPLLEAGYPETPSVNSAPWSSTR